MTPSEVVISKSLTSALELSEAFLIAETLDPADVGFSLAFHCLRQSLLVLCDSPYLYTEMAVTVRQRGFQLASTLDGGTQLLLGSEGFSWLVPWMEAPWELTIQCLH